MQDVSAWGLKSPQGPRVVIQARMGSTRLPGKIAADLCGRTLLERLVDRLSQAFSQVTGSQLVVATTVAPEDDQTEDICRTIGVGCVRGDVDDVLTRYLVALADQPDDATALRATGDNPLYCPVRSREIWEVHVQGANDYTCIDGLSYVVPEVFRVGALRSMAERAKDPYCREHVTPYFRQHPEEFRTMTLPWRWCGLRPDIRLTVDTPAELRLMQELFARAGTHERPFSLERAYELYDAGLLLA